jgi:hypothetical protein
MKRRMCRNEDTQPHQLPETKPHAAPESAPGEGRVALLVVAPGSPNRVIRCHNVDECYEVLDVEAKSADDLTIFVMSSWRNGNWAPIRRWTKDLGKLKGLKY